MLVLFASAPPRQPRVPTSTARRVAPARGVLVTSRQRPVKLARHARLL